MLALALCAYILLRPPPHNPLHGWLAPLRTFAIWRLWWLGVKEDMAADLWSLSIHGPLCLMTSVQLLVHSFLADYTGGYVIWDNILLSVVWLDRWLLYKWSYFRGGCVIQCSSYIICVWSTVCSGVWSVFPLPAGPASGKSISSKHLCLGVDPILGRRWRHCSLCCIVVFPWWVVLLHVVTYKGLYLATNKTCSPQLLSEEKASLGSFNLGGTSALNHCKWSNIVVYT